MKPGWLGYLGRLAGVLAGNALLAYGVAAVYLPAGLAVGGATGVGLILHTLFGLDTAVSVFVLNLGLLVAGWACIGREFAINTAAGSLAYPVFLGLCQRLPAFSLLETDRFAALVCGACFVGAGVGGYTSGRRFHRRQRLAGHDPAPDNPAAGSGGSKWPPTTA